jgi:hypothetical protein
MSTPPTSTAHCVTPSRGLISRGLYRTWKGLLRHGTAAGYLEADGGPERFKLFSDLNRQLAGRGEHQGEVRLRTLQQHLHTHTQRQRCTSGAGSNRDQSIGATSFSRAVLVVSCEKVHVHLSRVTPEIWESITSRIGSAKAPVFPEPVCASPMTSRPASHTGEVGCWRRLRERLNGLGAAHVHSFVDTHTHASNGGETAADFIIASGGALEVKARSNRPHTASSNVLAWTRTYRSQRAARPPAGFLTAPPIPARLRSPPTSRTAPAL